MGTVVAAGRLDDLIAQQREPADPELAGLMAEVDLAELMKTFALWAAVQEVTLEAIREIGGIALAAKTASEDKWIGYFRGVLPVEDWPNRPLKLTSVEAASGRFEAWERDSGVPIWTAVASSCAVPGLFPCVTIKGGRYTDGGVRSGTSADLASGYESVLMIAPIGAGESGIDPLLGRVSTAEAVALRAAGSNVELQFPDAQSLEAIGINRMDATRRPQVMEAGKLQGKALAGKIAGAWAKAAV